MGKRAKKPSPIDSFLSIVLKKFEQCPAEKLPEVGLYLFLTYISVKRFKSVSMAWYGPLAFRLATVQSWDNTSVNVGVMGSSFELPNAQTVGLSMLAFLGVLNILDTVKIPEPTGQEEQKEFVKERFGMDWEKYLEFRKHAT